MTGSPSAIPDDDPSRELAVARGDDAALPHVGIAGGTYTILLSGADTRGRYCLIDMLVPPGGGPPPHRHDFEEMFTVLEGEVQLTFRGTEITARTGDTVNVPANAPHFFRNVSREPARLLCMCSPAGQDEYFLLVGTPVTTRTTTPPSLPPEQQAAQREKGRALAPRFRTEFV